MTLASLFFLFMYIGTFTIGGGLVAISLMQQALVNRGIISAERFYNMVAISESTPGPIGINMATYVGYETAGVWGGIVTTVGTVLPSLVVIILIARYFTRFQDKPLVQAAFYGLRAGSTGLIAVAAWQVLNVSVFAFKAYSESGRWQDMATWPALGLFAVLLAVNRRFDIHPLWIILSGAVFGFFVL